MTQCVFESYLDGLRCKHCGYVLAKKYARVFRTCDTSGTATATVSWLGKAKNFAAASANHIAAGMPMASEDEIERRYAICQACPHLDGKACGKCGCSVNREKQYLSKLSWADQSCPDDPPRWGPVQS